MPDFKQLSDPRIIMRVIIGVLLAGNIAAAIVAFKPFGGSADDLRRERDSLELRLNQAQKALQGTSHLAAKVQTAREEGDKFVDKYLIDSHLASDVLVEELYRTSTVAQIKPGSQTYNVDPIEGSDSLQMWTISQGFEGTYANLVHFIELLDKSPRFLIIDNLQVAAPQGQGATKTLNVTLKIKVFVRNQQGAAL